MVKRSAFGYAFPLTVPICAGFLFLGISYGLYATGQGLPAFLPVLMSATIFAGSMEFVTVALLTAPFDPLGAFLLTLLVNARHIFYGLSMVTAYRGTGWKKIPLIYGMCDESFAINATTKIPDTIDKGWFYLHVTWLNYLYWVGGVALGSFGGKLITISLKGIEFVLTALFAVLFLELLLTAGKRLYCYLGFGITAAWLLAVGPERFMIPAMVTIVVVFLSIRRYKRSASDDSQPKTEAKEDPQV